MKTTFLIIVAILAYIFLESCFTWFGWNVCLANVFDLQKLGIWDCCLVSVGLNFIISPIIVSKKLNENFRNSRQ